MPQARLFSKPVSRTVHVDRTLDSVRRTSREGAWQSSGSDGHAIPEANADSAAGERAAWSRNEWSGDVSGFVPPSASRAFTVEFATERRGDPAPYRAVQSR